MHIMNDRLGYLVLNTYAGRRNYPVLITGETPKKFRIKILSEHGVMLPGRKFVNYNDVVLVPKSDIIENDQPEKR